MGEPNRARPHLNAGIPKNPCNPNRLSQISSEHQRWPIIQASAPAFLGPNNIADIEKCRGWDRATNPAWVVAQALLLSANKNNNTTVVHADQTTVRYRLCATVLTCRSAGIFRVRHGQR